MVGNIFELASRMKLRFSYKGMLSVEDIWDLSVQELDRIFKVLNAKLKVCKEESLLGSKSSENTELDLQVAIVRYIVEVKLAEAAARKMEAEKIAKRQKILAILAEKQEGVLASKTEEELTKMLEDL
jgi:hypothetical protein